MQPIVLRGNATPLYGFLSFLHTHLDAGDEQPRILDCGAGGAVPPLALFHQHGYLCQGIDISSEALTKANEFVQNHKFDITLEQADMRALPFADASFDAVYEHYSMCHLSKADTLKAISEMLRVIKPGGFAFFGVISDASFPIFGTEVRQGEYALNEGGHQVLHSYYADGELENLLPPCNIVQYETRKLRHRARINAITLEQWQQMYGDVHTPLTPAQWRAEFSRREELFVYEHRYYLVQKR